MTTCILIVSSRGRGQFLNLPSAVIPTSVLGFLLEWHKKFCSFFHYWLTSFCRTWCHIVSTVSLNNLQHIVAIWKAHVLWTNFLLSFPDLVIINDNYNIFLFRRGGWRRAREGTCWILISPDGLFILNVKFWVWIRISVGLWISADDQCSGSLVLVPYGS